MNKIKKITICISCACTILLGMGACGEPDVVDDPNNRTFGLFLGLNAEDAHKMEGYDLLILEGQEFSAEDIRMLHNAGQQVYSYLNIGAVEEYRDYYSRYKHLALGVYENWEDERWVNVADPEWQKFMIDTLAANLIEKGVDGFFLDNADVYYEFPQETIYQGLIAITKGLGKYNKTLMINGGDQFVLRLLDESKGKKIIQAVNQETVFTSIDFEKETYGRQTEEDRLYYQEYIETCADKGLSIFLTEYGASAALQKEIEDYCRQHGFLYYIAPTLELTGY
ncbi:MAG: endo alpha-1,4 polygalactosaminidase [Paludibacteraceae bacterium]|nr:endo alpha-1,4 polygalactosaminidase [Paludibacteraceae bacterium]